jgi:hypothetical protein
MRAARGAARRAWLLLADAPRRGPRDVPSQQAGPAVLYAGCSVCAKRRWLKIATVSKRGVASGQRVGRQ